MLTDTVSGMKFVEFVSTGTVVSMKSAVFVSTDTVSGMKFVEFVSTGTAVPMKSVVFVSTGTVIP